MIKFLPLLQGLSIIHVYSQKRLSRQSEQSERAHNEVNLLYGQDIKNNADIEFKYSEPKKLVYIEKFLLEFYICNLSNYNIFFKSNTRFVYFDASLNSLIDEVVKNEKNLNFELLWSKIGNTIYEKYVRIDENGRDKNINKKATQYNKNLDLIVDDLNSSNLNNNYIIFDNNYYDINKQLFLSQISIISQLLSTKEKFDQSISKLSNIPVQNVNKNLDLDISKITYKESVIFNDDIRKEISGISQNSKNSSLRNVIRLEDLQILPADINMNTESKLLRHFEDFSKIDDANLNQNNGKLDFNKNDYKLPPLNDFIPNANFDKMVINNINDLIHYGAFLNESINIEKNELVLENFQSVNKADKADNASNASNAKNEKEEDFEKAKNKDTKQNKEEIKNKDKDNGKSLVSNI